MEEKLLKRFLCLVLALIMIFSLCACGNAIKPAYRQLDILGIKDFALVFRSGDKSAQYVTAALSTLAANGTLSYHSRQWLGSDRICLVGDDAALYSFEEMPAERVYIVGVEENCRPLSYEYQGEYVGMSVDIARSIGQALGWEIRIQPIASKDIGIQLQSGNIDCAIGFGTEYLSREKFLISDTYMQSEIVLFATYDSNIKSIGRLKGKKVGYYGDQSVKTIVNANEKIAKTAGGYLEFSSMSSCFKALKNGSLSIAAMDSIILNANS